MLTNRLYLHSLKIVIVAILMTLQTICAPDFAMERKYFTYLSTGLSNFKDII